MPSIPYKITAKESYKTRKYILRSVQNPPLFFNLRFAFKSGYCSYFFAPLL